MDFCDMVWKLRSSFFAKDRDITLATGRKIFLADGTEIPSSALIPVGGIILWSGSVASIPANFQICNGTNGTPDLRDRFVIGAGSSYAVDATGGSTTKDLSHTHASGSYDTDSDSHSHGAGTLSNSKPSIGTAPTFGSGATASITEAQFEDHTHNISGSTASDSHSHDVQGTSGSGGSATQNVMNPYYALAFIQRLS